MTRRAATKSRSIVETAPSPTPTTAVPNDLPVSPDTKDLGAYYTDASIARFLARWGVRGAHDEVADPAFGGGVFLRAATERLLALEGNPARQVFGVEIDSDVHAHATTTLGRTHGFSDNLIRADFFEVEPTRFNPSVLLGNPPFIRYQRFSGSDRERALRRARDQGVTLNRLASSWAPFLVHAVACLRDGGRLGMVLPMELGHAAYARPVLEHLQQQFAQLTLLTFRRKLFPNLSQDCVLLLADNKGHGPADATWLDLNGPESLDELQGFPEGDPLDLTELIQGVSRLAEQFIPPAARALYRALRSDERAVPLGKLADVGIGYVTGGNDFFHLSPEDVRRWRIPQRFLRPAVRRGRGLKGLRYTEADWEAGVKTGEAGYLLHLAPRDDLPASVRRYVEHGEQLDVHLAYKCSVRSPWYAVPHVYHPDAFLTYMSGEFPRLVANDAGVVSPNSLHVVRLHEGVMLSPDALAVLWQTSLTRLSAELEGHAMGGGMLKLEPTEAERVLLAVTRLPSEALEAHAEHLDALTRAGQHVTAWELADDLVLGEGLGLTPDERRALRDAANTLRDRRYGR